MRTRLGPLGFIALVVACLVAAPAGAAAAGRPTHLSLSAVATTVSGRPLEIKAVLLDARGKPVAGALIRLVTTVTFMGKDHEEIVDEATTDPSGAARLSFAPTETGSTTVTARFSGSPGYAPVETSLALDVVRPVVAYHPEPVGLQAPWARSYFILLPFAGVWLTYLVALRQARGIRRAGTWARRLEGRLGSR